MFPFGPPDLTVDPSTKNDMMLAHFCAPAIVNTPLPTLDTTNAGGGDTNPVGVTKENEIVMLISSLRCDVNITDTPVLVSVMGKPVVVVTAPMGDTVYESFIFVGHSGLHVEGRTV